MHALVKGHSAPLSLEKQHRENPGAAFALFVNGSGGLFSRQDATSESALETAEDALDRLVVVDAEDGDRTIGEHVRGKLASELGVKNLILYHTEEKTLLTRRETYTREAAENFKGRIVVPDDLEVIEL